MHAPYAEDPPGSALPPRFAAALHRLNVAEQAQRSCAEHYRTVGYTVTPGQAWSPARRVLQRHTVHRPVCPARPMGSGAPYRCWSITQAGVWRLSYEPDVCANPQAGDTVVVEFTYRGSTGAGAPVARRWVHMTTVRDGLIATSRDNQAAITT